MGLGLALGAFLKCLFNGEFADEVQNLALERRGSALAGPAKGESQNSIESNPRESRHDIEGQKASELASEALALQMLADFQKEGRLIDFLEEDLSAYEDEEIGSSVRSIHEGCKKVMDQCLVKEKIVDQEEESSVRVNADYNVHEMKLSGRVSDKFPLKGVLVHPGWRVTSFDLKKRVQAEQGVLAPAEVEIG